MAAAYYGEIIFIASLYLWALFFMIYAGSLNSHFQFKGAAGLVVVDTFAVA